MAEKKRVNWSREETILAFELYCRTPFGKISHVNKDIIDLARLIGRTPSAVALKMFNLAHFDPELREKNVFAMAHGSKLDEKVFEEFYRNYGELSYQAMVIKIKMVGEAEDALNEYALAEVASGDYHDQLSKRRLGQDYFRTAVLNSYGNKCCGTANYNRWKRQINFGVKIA